MAQTKLVDLIEIEENNNNFILLKVIGSSEDLIKTGVFNGNESMFRVNKDENTRNITFFYKDGKFTSINHGSSTTCISKGLELQRDMLLQTIQEDLDTNVSTKKQQNLPQKKKDLKGKILKFTVYDNTCVHKNGRYLKHTKDLSTLITEIKNNYLNVKVGNEYLAGTTQCKAVDIICKRK